MSMFRIHEGIVGNRVYWLFALSSESLLYVSFTPRSKGMPTMTEPRTDQFIHDVPKVNGKFNSQVVTSHSY